MAIPKYTKGKLPLVPKKKDGQPLKSKVEALDDPRGKHVLLACCLPGTLDKGSVATGPGKTPSEISMNCKAIMDYVRRPPVKTKGELPTIPASSRCALHRSGRSRLA